jgi:pyruvate kinase
MTATFRIWEGIEGGSLCLAGERGRKLGIVPYDPSVGTNPASEPRTKIVCTVGPACRDVPTLAAMTRAGADVFRVNGAHVEPAAIGDWVERVRRAAREAGRQPAVLVDLPGTKIRLGDPGAAEVPLAAGARVRLVPASERGGPGRLPVEGLTGLGAVPVGAEVLLQDGRVRLRVLEAGARGLVARVEDPGAARKGMGVHFPGVPLPTAVPTERDRELVRAAVKAGVDWVSQSFVRSVDDLSRLRGLLESLRARRTATVAKIERLDAVAALDSILGLADAVMVARGDLGVDASPERVPSLQLRILEAGARAGRPVIVATEMLESMVTSTRPTRAEASDVANAVFQGADAVMLSGETAVGVHPVRVVETMARVLGEAEKDPQAPYAGSPRMPVLGSRRGRPDEHVVHAAVTLAREARAEAIVVFTRTGASAVRLSKERPAAPIHAFAPTDEVCRRLALAWGVRAQRLPAGRGTDALLRGVVPRLKEEGLAPGARAVLLMGGADDPAGATTLIKLMTL